jgi:hypothetical protein
LAFLNCPAGAPVPDPLKGKSFVALRVCYPGDAEERAELAAPVRKVGGIVFDSTRRIPFREIGSVTMDSPLRLPRIGYSESLREVGDPLIAALPEVLTPTAPFAAMELRHAAGGAALPPESHRGLGYWDSPFLFFGMSVISDPSAEPAVAALGESLDAILESCRTGTNALTFLLPQHTPQGDGEAGRVRQVYRPDHYARLTALKKRCDPDNLLGGDRNIPPA